MGYQVTSRSRAGLQGKRVVFVFGGLDLGGAERQGLLLAQHLAHEHRARVQVWGFGPPGQVATYCEEQDIPWKSVEFPWTAGRATRLTSLVKFAGSLQKIGVDLLLPYTMPPNLICGSIWRLTGASACVWNQRDEGRGRMGPKIERWAVGQTPWFIANSQHGAEFLSQVLGAKRERIRVIPNGVELPPPKWNRSSWRSRLEIGDEDFVACMVANLTVWKDHATLLQAWRRVVGWFDTGDRSAILLLAGSFVDTHHALKALAYDLELGRSVRFLGRVDDVSGLLTSVDLGVFSSRLEGCPNGVLEPMAAGLAVVCTDIPGIREAVGPEGDSLLVPPADPAALADKILEAALDANLRQRLGLAGARRIELEFSPQRMLEQSVAVLSRACMK